MSGVEIVVIKRDKFYSQNFLSFSSDLQEMKGFVYILECADGSYYTGSTKNLNLRILQHKMGEGANHTKKRLPIKLVYFEEFERIDLAFYREKQIQGWRRDKKEALISLASDKLHELARCLNKSSHVNFLKKDKEE